MMVKVRFYMQFREIVGQREIILKATNIRELLKKIGNAYPQLKKELFKNLKTSEPHDWLVILVNGNHLKRIGGLDLILENGSIIDIFPPVVGG